MPIWRHYWLDWVHCVQTGISVRICWSPAVRAECAGMHVIKKKYSKDRGEKNVFILFYYTRAHTPSSVRQTTGCSLASGRILSQHFPLPHLSVSKTVKIRVYSLNRGEKLHIDWWVEKKIPIDLQEFSTFTCLIEICCFFNCGCTQHDYILHLRPVLVAAESVPIGSKNRYAWLPFFFRELPCL